MRKCLIIDDELCLFSFLKRKMIKLYLQGQRTHEIKFKKIEKRERRIYISYRPRVRPAVTNQIDIETTARK